MESIIIIGHGSPREEANNIEMVGTLLHSSLHPDCGDGCVEAAYLQFAKPGIEETIRKCVDRGARKIIVHPYFLSEGMHVTKDIPELISNAMKSYPDIEFVYTEPLGIHQKMVHVVRERIESAVGRAPGDIERKSFDLISEEADFSGVPAERVPVVKRVIHATADFEFMRSLKFHPDAIGTAVRAIRSGKNILTDVEMVKTGINKKLLAKWGGTVTCEIADDDVARRSGDTGKTRAEIAIEKGLNGTVGIVAIGNAPTALLKAIEILERLPQSDPKPLIIGVPVGFVNAIESKVILSEQKFPYITNISRKGGTPVAVAIVNALIKMTEEEQ